MCQLMKPTRKPSGRQKPPENSTNSHILVIFSQFSQPIFYLVKNGLHQCVPENFPVKNDMLFLWKTKKIMVKMNSMCSICTIKTPQDRTRSVQRNVVVLEVCAHAAMV